MTKIVTICSALLFALALDRAQAGSCGDHECGTASPDGYSSDYKCFDYLCVGTPGDSTSKPCEFEVSLKMDDGSHASEPCREYHFPFCYCRKLAADADNGEQEVCKWECVYEEDECAIVADYLLEANGPNTEVDFCSLN